MIMQHVMMNQAATRFNFIGRHGKRAQICLRSYIVSCAYVVHPHPIPAAGTMDSDIVTLFQSFGEVSFEYAEKAGKLVGDITVQHVKTGCLVST